MNDSTLPVNVCHCLISGGFGGIERQVHSLADIQRKLGRVGVLFAIKGGPFADEIERLSGVDTLCLKLKSGFDLNPLKVLKAMRFLANFDIAHIHSFNFVFLFAAILARKKIIFTIHGITKLHRKLNWRDLFINLLVRITARDSLARITTVSAFMREKMKNYIDTRDEVPVIFNICPSQPASVRLSEDVRKELGIGKDEFLITTYGRLVVHKRTDLLVEAAAELNNKKNIPKFRCLIIGDGPHKEHILEQIRILGIDNRVILLPFQKAIFDYINASDICVFPARYEPFGIVALEALSMGKPVLVMSDGGGLAEVLRTVLHGRFINMNVAQLVDGMIDLMKITVEKDMNVLSAVMKAKAAEFTAEVINNKYMDLYRKALKYS